MKFREAAASFFAFHIVPHLHRDLLYLCDFSRREFLESRSNTDLISHGAKIVLARGTGALTGVKKKIDAPESTRPYSDFINWQIGVLLHKEILSMPEAQDLLTDYDDDDDKKRKRPTSA